MNHKTQMLDFDENYLVARKLACFKPSSLTVEEIIGEEGVKNELIKPQPSVFIKTPDEQSEKEITINSRFSFLLSHSKSESSLNFSAPKMEYSLPNIITLKSIGKPKHPIKVVSLSGKKDV